MYAVATVIDAECTAAKGCRLCILYCPEADTIVINQEKKVAEVVEDRCKGCELCIQACSVQHATKMIHKS